MAMMINQNQGILASKLQNIYQQPSFFRSVVDSICKFFTGHLTEATMEKLAVQKEINDAVVRAVRQQPENQTSQLGEFHARESIDLSIKGQRITIRNDYRGGVSIGIAYDEIFIPTELNVQDLINNAVMTNGGGDINTTSVQKQINSVVINEIEQASLNKYQKNGIFTLKQPTNGENYDMPLFGTINERIHLAKEQSLDGSGEILPKLDEMRKQAIEMKGASNKEHVILMVFGVHKLQSRLLDSDHYVCAAVSSNPNIPPTIMDSKNFAVYPAGINVLRSGHQAATDTISCGAHSLRAMNGFAIQLASGKEFIKLTPPPAFNSEMCAENIDVNEIVISSDENYRRIIKEATAQVANLPPDAIQSFDDEEI